MSQVHEPTGGNASTGVVAPPPIDDASETDELRLAVVMSGGVSLCVWMGGVAQELDRQGMQDVVLYHPNTYDQSFIAESGDLFEGDVVSVQFRPLEASSEGNALADFQTWMDKQGSTPTELAMVGWINASLAFDGLLAEDP